MLIKARLRGHEFDLLTLAELFREGEPAVASDDKGYCLSFTAPDRLLDDGARCPTPRRCRCAASTA